MSVKQKKIQRQSINFYCFNFLTILNPVENSYCKLPIQRNWGGTMLSFFSLPNDDNYLIAPGHEFVLLVEKKKYYFSLFYLRQRRSLKLHDTLCVMCENHLIGFLLNYIAQLNAIKIFMNSQKHTHILTKNMINWIWKCHFW
jgi:hypothetical protein